MLKNLKERLSLKLKDLQERGLLDVSRKNLILINLILFLFVNSLQMIVGKFLNLGAAWAAWDLTILFNCIILAFTLFISIEYRQTLNKIISFAIFIISCWFALDYIILTISQYYENDIFALALITNIIFFIYFVPHFIFLCIRSYTEAGDAYEDGKTYVVYKAPKNVVGIACALITNPYGSQSMVINGRQFLFKGGILIEREYISKKSDILKHIKSVNIQALRCNIRIKWSINTNCFTFFNKYIRHIKNEKLN